MPADKYVRQKTFLRALKASGPITIIEGRYSSRPYVFPKSGCTHKIPKEKFTDVNIAVNIVGDAFLNKSSHIVLVSGDMDQIPTLAFLRTNFPNLRIRVVFPPERLSNDLAKLAHDSFMISESLLTRSLMPNPVINKRGVEIFKPDLWD